MNNTVTKISNYKNQLFILITKEASKLDTNVIILLSKAFTINSNQIKSGSYFTSNS